MHLQRILIIGFVGGIGVLALVMALASGSSSNTEDWSVRFESGEVLEGHWPKEVLEIEQEIHDAAVRSGIQPELFAALIMVESYGWENCPAGPITMSCISTTGAIGPAQVQPSFHYGPQDDESDLQTNLDIGAEVLREYIDLMGNTKQGLMAYNCGPEKFDLCSSYARKVFTFLQSSGNKCILMCLGLG